uniref:UPI0001A88450 related cluster n=1 Tax=Saccharum spontaneum TaxID=62335 RepID=A0A678T4L9_SACSP|nr:UPI0001A88450 related cluster [Saccharum spontaneum]
MLSFSDSEASSDESSEPSPLAGSDKGKAAVVPGHAWRHRRPRNVAGGSWRTLIVNQLCVLVATLHRQGTPGHQPRFHVPRAGEHVDVDSFMLVESRRRWRRKERPMRSTCRPIPPTLVGLCFNCLTGDHVTAVCRLPSRCLLCRGMAHQARDYKCGRSPTRAATPNIPSSSAPNGGQPPLPASQVSPPMSSPRDPFPPPGHPSTHPISEIVVIPRTVELSTTEEALSSLALVAMNSAIGVSGRCSSHLESFYHISSEEFTVSRYAPEDFLVRFIAREDLENVVHALMPLNTPFYLVWKWWRRQSMASVGAMRFKVLLGLKGLLVHTWSTDTVVEAPQTVPREDLREYFVTAWCIHPMFIPSRRSSRCMLPFVVAPIQFELPTLRYLVRIRVVETQDWNAPPSDDDNDSPGDSGDTNVQGERGRSRPWPRRYRFGNNDSGQDAGAAPDPHLGRVGAVLIGDIPCSVFQSAGPSSPSPSKEVLLLTDTLCRQPSSRAMSCSAHQSPVASRDFEFRILSQPPQPPLWLDLMLLCGRHEGLCPRKAVDDSRYSPAFFLGAGLRAGK